MALTAAASCSGKFGAVEFTMWFAPMALGIASLLGTTNYVHRLSAVGKAAQLVEHLTRIGRSGGVVLTALGMLDTMRLKVTQRWCHCPKSVP